MHLNKYPKISIVTPSYNQGQYIEQTIQSVLSQNYPNFQYIIIDGGSTDNTIDIIKKYESKITYWISEKDRGQSHAINKGIEKCTGDIFNWLNSDDYLNPNSLFEIAAEYQDKPFVALCGKVNVHDETGFSHVRKSTYIGTSIADSIVNYNINQEGTWWGLKTIKELGGVNEAFQYSMDFDLLARAFLNCKMSSFRNTSVILSNFRRHSEAKSTISNNQDAFVNNFFLEELVVFDKLTPKSFKTNELLNKLNVCSKPHLNVSGQYPCSEELKESITEMYLFKILNKAYYIEEFKQAFNCISLLKKLNLKHHKKDVAYLRRKLFFKRFRLLH